MIGKNLIVNGLIGMACGILLNFLFVGLTFIMGWRNGCNVPCLPELLKYFDSPISAVIFQTEFCGILGFIVGIIPLSRK